MAVGIWLGFLTSNTVAQGASIALGVNIVQNTNKSKLNNGNTVYADSIVCLPVITYFIMDLDAIDTLSFDNNNFSSLQV
ncbi:hypothetical protein [Effusibacillus dendaii]|uniref:Uncharacterized protein n=1 Tax=Effusibacillus dendaii TaxID=2743772 RepID=A0A7I8DFJ2_9BACL|nr:hypothetical protein [Effusibacillus dendaii]BCJ86671.1 hypothetical protein skT53_16560 [Effusibacillus dendaii]